MIYEYARTDMPISFPGLFGEWSVNPDPVAIPVGNGVRWYGIIICLGLILAVLFCCRRAKDYGITEETVYDMMIWQIPLCIIGARIYYVVFYLDFYRRLPALCYPLLAPGGLLALEIGEDQGEAVAGLAAAAGFRQVEVRKDLSGLDRVVLGRR